MPEHSAILTRRQRQVLDFFEAYQEREGAPPSFRDVCREFGFSSLNATKGHFVALAKKGYLRIRRADHRNGSRINYVLAERSKGRAMPEKDEERHAPTIPGGDLAVASRQLSSLGDKAEEAGDLVTAKRQRLAAVSLSHAVAALAGRRDGEPDPKTGWI